MKKMLTHLAPHQAGKVLAIIYLPIAVISAIIMGLSMSAYTGGSGVMIVVATLVGYPLLVYGFTALGCWLYNIVAGRFGGIEITLTDVEEGTPS